MTSHYFSILELILIAITLLMLWVFIKLKKMLWVFIKLKNTKLLCQARRLPPGPWRLPIVGNLHQLGKLPHLSIQCLSKEFGPLMFLQVGSVPTLVISSVDMVRAIFKTHDIIFSGRPDLYVAKKISYNFNNIAFGTYGEAWREIKKVAVSELLSSKRVQSFQAVREEEVEFVLDYIAGSTGPVNLSKLSLLLTTNIICRLAFGDKKYCSGGNGSTNRFDEVLHETLTLLGQFSMSDYFPRLRWLNKFNGLQARVDKNFRELDELYDEVIRDHLDPTRPKNNHDNLVDVLLRRQKDSSQGFALTNQQIKGVITDMFIAGTDTSASTIVWTMVELMKNPSVMKRAQAEVREVAKGKAKVEENDIAKVTYLKSIIKESFRLHPPAPLLVPRETLEDCVVENYKIPAKTRVFIDVRSIGTDPRCWENPHEFQPDRFLNNPVDFRGKQFELIPFGVGRRGCPGTAFAVSLVELALANLLHRFDWNLPDGVEDLDMEAVFGLTMYKKAPLCLVPTTVVV